MLYGFPAAEHRLACPLSPDAHHHSNKTAVAHQDSEKKVHIFLILS